VTSSLRASDSDREHAGQRLRHATAEGRLTADELEQRLDVLYRTRTYGELDALVADLPVSTSARAVRARVPRWVGVAAALAVLLALLGLLAGAARHSTEAVEGPRHGGQFGFSAAPLESHRLMIAAASQVALFALLVVCVVLLWLLMRSRNPRVPASRGVR
jgi:Domain of unknown function (DUF1707)